MGADLQEARRIISADRRLQGFTVRREGGELHLEKKGDSFVRLLPAAGGKWQLELFRDAEEWEIVDMTGTLEECLTYLAENHNFRFWEG